MTFFNPVNIIYCDDIEKKLKSIIGSEKHILITTEGSIKRGTVQSQILRQSNMIISNITPNPTLQEIEFNLKEIQNINPSYIVAIGGGSVIDTAKALAACLVHEQDWLQNHFFKQKPFKKQFNPPTIIALPTTAGTGSEMTQWATLWDPETKNKFSLSHPALYPKFSLISAALTLSVPKDQTIFTALDAMSQSLESIWNNNANPISMALASRAVQKVLFHLPRVIENPESIEDRIGLIEASSLSGFAFSNTKTAIAHSISYPLTLEFGIPHGLACSFTLGEIINILPADEKIVEAVCIAFNCSNTESARTKFYSFFDSLKIKSLLQRYIQNREHAENCQGSYINVTRAANFIVNVNEHKARDIVRLALEKIYKDG